MSWDMATGYITLDLKQLLKWCKDSNTNSIGSLQSRVTLIPSLDPTDVGGAAEEFAEISMEQRGYSAVCETRVHSDGL
jgi:hypothetical protein